MEFFGVFSQSLTDNNKYIMITLLKICFFLMALIVLAILHSTQRSHVFLLSYFLPSRIRALDYLWANKYSIYDGFYMPYKRADNQSI